MKTLRDKIAVLGLGIIGGTWAQHFYDDGRLVAAWNRTPKRDFPQWVENPGEAVERAGTVIIVLSDPPAVSALLDKITPHLKPGHLVIQSTTIDPGSSERFSETVRSTGATYLEAPFTGSKPAAEARKVVFYLGGEREAISAAETVLEPISEVRLTIGSCNQAATLKLAMNLQIAVQAGALCESLSVVREAGVSDDVFFGALGRNVACSGLTKLKEGKLREGDYSPQFSVKHMLKDMRLLLGMQSPAPLTLAAGIEGALARAAEGGWADEDFIALMKTLG